MFSGGKDADCECNGTGVMEYDDGTYLAGTWSHGKREGHFKFDTSHPKSTINYLEGVYKDDELCGKARAQLRDESWIEGYFKDSVLHGFCRYFDKEKHLTFIGMHRNGKPFGTCWKLIKGGGYIVGRVNEDGQLTGSDIAYLFPNIETAFVGQFVDGVLKEARVSKICDVILDYGCIKVPKFAEPTGPMYQRELSTSEFVTNSPLLKDPYEEKMVFVKQSLVEGAQEGLFSRQAVKANTIMAFYNGIRRKKLQIVNKPGNLRRMLTKSLIRMTRTAWWISSKNIIPTPITAQAWRTKQITVLFQIVNFPNSTTLAGAWCLAYKLSTMWLRGKKSLCGTATTWTTALSGTYWPGSKGTLLCPTP